MRQSLSPVQGLQSFSPSSPFATSPSSAGLSGSPSPRTPFSSHPSDFGTPEIPTQSNQQQHPFHAAQSSPIIDARLPQLRVTVAADTLLALAQPVINSRSHLSTNFSPSTSNTSPTQVTAARRTALHAIQSLTLLAHLAYAQSRPIEGHKHLGAAVRLALACNLHRLPASAPNIRGAVDAELEAARETWWMVFCTERAWAGVGLGVEGGGFDTVLDDGGVLTPFGVIGISKNEWGGLEVTRPVGLSGHRSIQQVRLICHPEERRTDHAISQPSDIMIGATESLESLSAKTYALAARVSQLSARWTATHDPALTSNISHIIHILEYLVYSPPTIRPASGSPQSPVPSTTEMQLVALSLLSRLRQVMGDTSSALSSARQFAQLLATLNEGALTMLHGSLGRHLLEIGRVLCEVPGTEADAEFVRNAGAVCTTRMPYLSGACGATST